MTARWLGIGLGLFLICGVGVSTVSAQQPQRPPEGPRLKLRSPAFPDAGMLPAAHTCTAEGGMTQSPPLEWSYTPEGTQSFVLLVNGTDNHPRKGIEEETFWVMWNIPGTATGLPAGIPAMSVLPDGSHQATGNRGIIGYRGPCAPKGVGALHYAFILYALDTMLDLPETSVRRDVMQAMDGHILGSSMYSSVFEQH